MTSLDWLSVETLTEDDVLAINRLMQQLTAGGARDSDAIDIKRILRRANKHWCIIRNDSDTIIGMGILTTDENPDHGIFGRIDCVVVDTDARIRGLGTIIDERLTQRAKEMHCEFIDLTSSKKEGIAFWLKRGYVPRSTISFRKKIF